MPNRFIVIATLLFALTPAALVVAEDVADYEARIKAVDDQIKQLADEVQSVRTERTALVEKMSSTGDLIKDRARRINALQQDIEHYEGTLTRLENKLQESESRVTTNKQLLATLIRSAMQVGESSGMQVMFQHTDPALASRIGTYYEYYFRASTAQISVATEQLAGIRQAHSEAQKSRNWLAYLQKKATGQKQTYSGQHAQSARSIDQVDAVLNEKQRGVESLREDQQRLAELLKKLKENKLGASGFFASGKGRYPWPVSGKLTARYDDLKSVGKLKWTGIYIEAPAGGVVRTIAAGEVVYADWLQGFGMLVIVDHGDGYMTLYGGNRELAAVQGAWVETGSKIATVGDSRGHKKPGLYFEIRHNANPVNPESWVSPENRFNTADN